jgi:hypothetical protein
MGVWISGKHGLYDISAKGTTVLFAWQSINNPDSIPFDEFPQNER